VRPDVRRWFARRSYRRVATIGRIVATVRRDGVDRVPLVDKLRLQLRLQIGTVAEYLARCAVTS
jgi:hypothetical protein